MSAGVTSRAEGVAPPPAALPRPEPGHSRRRGATLEAAIRSAVLDLVVEHGVGAVTMEAVAARAGTSKPVLYRRWPDRTALLRDALVASVGENAPPVDTHSYRGDVIELLGQWAELFTSRLGAAVGPAIVGALPQDPALARAFREGIVIRHTQEMAAALARGIARGEVRTDVPVEMVAELGQAMLWHRFLVAGLPVDDGFVVHIVDDVLIPFVSPLTTDRRAGRGAPRGAGRAAPSAPPR